MVCWVAAGEPRAFQRHQPCRDGPLKPVPRLPSVSDQYKRGTGSLAAARAASGCAHLIGDRFGSLWIELDEKLVQCTADARIFVVFDKARSEGIPHKPRFLSDELARTRRYFLVAFLRKKRPLAIELRSMDFEAVDAAMVAEEEAEAPAATASAEEDAAEAQGTGAPVEEDAPVEDEAALDPMSLEEAHLTPLSPSQDDFENRCIALSDIVPVLPVTACRVSE